MYVHGNMLCLLTISRELVLVHLDRNTDKFNLLMYVGICTYMKSCTTPVMQLLTTHRFMARKLYAFASGECMAESADSPMNQEILLGGHLYLMVLKVCFQEVCFLFPLEIGVKCCDLDISHLHDIFPRRGVMLPSS